jgi:hypothetical protein
MILLVAGGILFITILYNQVGATFNSVSKTITSSGNGNYNFSGSYSYTLSIGTPLPFVSNQTTHGQINQLIHVNQAASLTSYALNYDIEISNLRLLQNPSTTSTTIAMQLMLVDRTNNNNTRVVKWGYNHLKLTDGANAVYGYNLALAKTQNGLTIADSQLGTGATGRAELYFTAPSKLGHLVFTYSSDYFLTPDVAIDLQ